MIHLIAKLASKVEEAEQTGKVCGRTEDVRVCHVLMQRRPANWLRWSL
jgi:hypothetical protein